MAPTELAAECTPAAAELPDGAWICLADSDLDDREVDCEDRVAIPDYIYFQPPGEPPSCDGIVLSLSTKRGPDACDENVAVTFTSASSDEPVNDKGDGNTEPDIILDCDRVQLRSERQGGGNGRTYRLVWTAVDDVGNVTMEGECVVRVPHDQSGKDVEDTDEADYRVNHDVPGKCEGGVGGAGGEGGMGGGS